MESKHLQNFLEIVNEIKKSNLCQKKQVAADFALHTVCRDFELGGGMAW